LGSLGASDCPAGLAAVKAGAVLGELAVLGSRELASLLD
jgi:hypothetical protein